MGWLGDPTLSISFYLNIHLHEIEIWHIQSNQKTKHWNLISIGPLNGHMYYKKISNMSLHLPIMKNTIFIFFSNNETRSKFRSKNKKLGFEAVIFFVNGEYLSVKDFLFRVFQMIIEKFNIISLQSSISSMIFSFLQYLTNHMEYWFDSIKENGEKLFLLLSLSLLNDFYWNISLENPRYLNCR